MECIVFTRGSAAARASASVAAASLLLLAGVAVAFAGNLVNLNCVGGLSVSGGAGNFNCVSQWATGGDPNVRPVPRTLPGADKADASPHSLPEAGRAEAAARDRQWRARCKPIIARDVFGVARYYYSAPGCEFGVGAN
jgi:hypothetical protein